MAGEAAEILNTSNPRGEYGEPTWQISHGEHECEVVCMVWERPEGYVFGYIWDWGHTCDGFFECETKDKMDAKTARQYAMNGGGDVAADNQVEWNPNWMQWIDTGEEQPSGSDCEVVDGGETR